MALNIEYTIDEKTYRRFMNGVHAVTHCDHYVTMFTKLAIEMAEYGGPQILADSLEDSLRPLFDDYFQQNGIAAAGERLNVACEFYSLMGLGIMQAQGEESGGAVSLSKSHVDQGWLAKLGKNDAPVNHLTRGFIAAMFAAVHDKPARSYDVEEAEGIVQGENASRFTVQAK